jgi:hypothetical protein
VRWNYAGSPSGGTLSPERESYHTEILNNLYSWYSGELAIYQQELDAALRNLDGLRVSQIKAQMNALTQQYNNDVAADNARYAAEKAAASKVDNTRFDLWEERDSTSNPYYVDGRQGPGGGEARFQALAGSDYYFSVKASGPWSLAVYWQAQ